MTTRDPFEMALAYFQPSLPSGRREPVLEALRAIAEDYRRNATNKVRFTEPTEKVGETPEEHALRLQALSETPIGKGRPKGLAAALMVHALRRLVVQEGRDDTVSLKYDGPTQTFRYPCPLASLAEAIDEAVGNPTGKKAHSAWRNIAAEVSRPLWEMETFFALDPEGLSPKERNAFNQDLKSSEVRPHKRRKA